MLRDSGASHLLRHTQRLKSDLSSMRDEIERVIREYHITSVARYRRHLYMCRLVDSIASV